LTSDYDGKARDSGTRITVELILHKLAEGASEDELLGDTLTLREKTLAPQWVL
jgi:uncharacterized protein (DUF433 family)